MISADIRPNSVFPLQLAIPIADQLKMRELCGYDRKYGHVIE